MVWTWSSLSGSLWHTFTEAFSTVGLSKTIFQILHVSTFTAVSVAHCHRVTGLVKLQWVFLGKLCSDFGDFVQILDDMVHVILFRFWMTWFTYFVQILDDMVHVILFRFWMTFFTWFCSDFGWHGSCDFVKILDDIFHVILFRFLDDMVHVILFRFWMTFFTWFCSDFGWHGSRDFVQIFGWHGSCDFVQVLDDIFHVILFRFLDDMVHVILFRFWTTSGRTCGLLWWSQRCSWSTQWRWWTTSCPRWRRQNSSSSWERTAGERVTTCLSFRTGRNW